MTACLKNDAYAITRILTESEETADGTVKMPLWKTRSWIFLLSLKKRAHGLAFCGFFNMKNSRIAGNAKMPEDDEKRENLDRCMICKSCKQVFPLLLKSSHVTKFVGDSWH